MSERDVLQQVTEAIRSIRFGTVHITIHDSKVVQIEKAEKIRMSHEADRTTGGSHMGLTEAKED